MHVKRHERETFFRHALGQAANLGAVEQQLARAHWFVRADTVTELVGGDVHVLEPHLAVRDVGIRLGDLHFSGAHTLYFTAVQHDASLNDIDDRVLVSGAPIAREHWVFCIVLRHVSELSLGSVIVVQSRRLVITDDVEQQIVAHARACKPQEMCGLLVGHTSTDSDVTSAGTNRVLEFHPCRNVAASAIVYTLDPKDYMRIEQSADDRGLAVLGVVHSHTHTEAYPSPTDVAQALDPLWNYAIVSLKYDPPRLRNFRIVAGEISETAIDTI